jgi:hypothetical protein
LELWVCFAAVWKFTVPNRRAGLYPVPAGARARLAEERAEWTRLTAAVGKVLRAT